MRTYLFIALAALTACDDPASNVPEDGADDTFLANGKADNSFEGCGLDNVLRWLNTGDQTVDAIKAKGVHTRAAKGIIAFRAGADDEVGTDDDRVIPDLETLDAIKYVGPVALRQLVAGVGTECPSAVESAVVFSPQLWENSHAARVVAEMDATQRSIDIAMYSFRDRETKAALARAVDRGVTVRMVFEGARFDQRNPEGTPSADFEAMGVDVRYINKIMHHKMALFDGVQSDPAEAITTRIATGSGNWSSSAATKYDENTVFLSNHPEAALRFQREFNLLWENSRSFETAAQPDVPYFATKAITDADIAAVDDPGFDLALTSANFEPYVSNRYGPTFGSIRGASHVANRVIKLIESAEHEILVASGHLRSRPISEALMAAMERNPNLVIKAYLDNQEFVSSWSHDRQLADLDECLIEAGDSDSKRESCLNKGFRFGYQVARAGIDVRYKYYHYKWDVRNASQMHHKYLLVDGKTLASGSYNFSDNAEHNTIENMVVYSVDAFPKLITEFRDNFEMMWVTGEAEGLYDVFIEDLATGTDDVALHFAPMALDWNQVTALRDAIYAACPEAGSLPRGTRICERPSEN